MEDSAKKDYLPEVIEKTRRARIEAERRLLFCDHLGKVANASFACWTTVFALFAFMFPSSQWLAFVTVGVSVTLAIISFHTSAQAYGVRAAQMRANYIGLHRLWLELDSVDAASNPDEYADWIGERYLDLLSCSENHSEEDHLKAYRGNAKQANNANSEMENADKAGMADRRDKVTDTDKIGTSEERDKADEADGSSRTSKTKGGRCGLRAMAMRHPVLASSGIAASPLALAVALKLLYQFVECSVNNACI